MNIVKAQLSIISMPLKKPFSTHLGIVKEREAIIIELWDREGEIGYGETVAFSSPWYTEETVKTAYHMQKDFILPVLLKKTFAHPDEFSREFSHLRGNEMAKSGIETALWDLYAKKRGKSLATLLGGTRKVVRAGAVVATQDLKRALTEIEKFCDQGFERIKLKISPANDLEWIRNIRREVPDVPLMADANSAYTLADVDRLRALDEFDLLMIEQPLGPTDLVEHAILQKQITTPICLDESITNVHDAKSAIQLGSCQIMNIKVGRVGGLTNAKQIHDLCMENKLQVWCGGMIEFGISKAHNLALASLPGFTLPGDLSPSTHYWEEDIIDPPIEMDKGKITVPSLPGMGFSVNEQRLEEVCRHKEIITTI
ncbi:o-succinylbenzoate synthase [Lederbergia sp. NSJ-179]|uniref:o-succinylbenzoate synthase n=1 Tax=Lederbergia sp. NSJ-179 TaxID=2931402 RepID=UPI001FD44BA7|nr:o-succinylbenzoate synthase [Lederbergia sp. NSJ-179]MCJ7842703.1 o-succinylbenzoate synthase [Lederbergia sp. NSJ-179]